MALGTIMPKSLIQQQLYDMNKDYRGNQIWKSAYDTVTAQENVAMAQAKNVYENDVAQAYLAAQRNQNMMSGGSYFDSTRQYLADENRANLAKAYESFRQNYASNVANIQSTASQSRAAIDEALARESEYATQFTDILNSGEYLNWVAENSPDFFGEKSEYRQDLIDLGVLTPNADNTGYVQTTDNLFSTANGTIDVDGNLTEKGKNLYRFMLNMDIKGEGYSLTNFLMSNKNYGELSEWLTSQGTNQYDSNYEMVLNDILGIDSNSAKYIGRVPTVDNSYDLNLSPSQYNERITELEDMFKLGQISEETYNSYKEQMSVTRFDDYDVKMSGFDDFDDKSEPITIKRNGVKYELNAGAKITDANENNTLTKLYGGKPVYGSIVMYGDKAYIYGKNTWHELTDGPSRWRLSTSGYNKSVKDFVAGRAKKKNGHLKQTGGFGSR